MFESLILGLASLFQKVDTPFFEQPVDLPAGVFEMKTDRSWNSISLFTTDGTALPEISFQNSSGNFEVWEHGDAADSSGVILPGKERKDILDALFFDEVRKSIVLKSSAPVHVVAHFYNTIIPGENLVAQFDSDTETLLNDQRIPAEIKLGKGVTPKFYTREAWGADEDLRLLSKDGKKVKAKRWFETEIDLVPARYHPVVEETTDADGNPLFWPISRSPEIAKFVIHHTGEAVKDGVKKDPMAVMRAIYYYHTITRGWGDIGYNYVIDKQGNIYEGRAGGPTAVGAHTAYHNIGTIGISLMGNFNVEEPTEAQLNVVSLLIADHARRFKVDPLGRSDYLGKNSYNISGHQDVAAIGHGTSCPGKNLEALLPTIRQKVADFLKIFDALGNESEGGLRGLDFLMKSRLAPNVLKQKEKFQLPEKSGPAVSFSGVLQPEIFQRNSAKSLEVKIYNGTDFLWPKNSVMTAEKLPDGIRMLPFRSQEDIPPALTGTFSADVIVTNIPNGQYYFDIVPTFLTGKMFDSQIKKNTLSYPIQISGDKQRAFSEKQVTVPTVTASSILSQKTPPTATFTPAPIAPKISSVKVKLSTFNQGTASVESSESVGIWENSRKIIELPAKTEIKITAIREGGGTGGKKLVQVEADGKSWTSDWISLRTTGALEIKNYTNGLFGSTRVRYNKFRERLNFHHVEEKKLLVVNELPMEEYLWGIAEEPNKEPIEKRNAIFVLARSYALVYSGDKRKFHTELYDLEDSPATSQLYLGYDWEFYHNDQKQVVARTEGRVLTYNGSPVIGPYFTQSSGRSLDIWQKQYPWTKAQELPYDKGLEQKGHGVGLSGNTARKLAEEGKKYPEILKYFFDGVEIEKVY